PPTSIPCARKTLIHIGSMSIWLKPFVTWNAIQEKWFASSSSARPHGPGRLSGLSRNTPAPSKTLLDDASARALAASTQALSTARITTRPFFTALAGNLAPAELGRALFHERVQALARVLRGPGEVEGPALELDPHRERRLEGLVDRLLREPHGHRP